MGWVGAGLGWDTGNNGLSRFSPAESAAKLFMNSTIGAVQGALMLGVWYDLLAHASKRRTVSLRFLFAAIFLAAIALWTFVYWSGPSVNPPGWLASFCTHWR